MTLAVAEALTPNKPNQTKKSLIYTGHGCLLGLGGAIMTASIKKDTHKKIRSDYSLTMTYDGSSGISSALEMREVFTYITRPRKVFLSAKRVSNCPLLITLICKHNYNAYPTPRPE